MLKADRAVVNVEHKCGVAPDNRCWVQQVDLRCSAGAYFNSQTEAVHVNPGDWMDALPSTLHDLRGGTVALLLAELAEFGLSRSRFSTTEAHTSLVSGAPLLFARPVTLRLGRRTLHLA